MAMTRTSRSPSTVAAANAESARASTLPRSASAAWRRSEPAGAASSATSVTMRPLVAGAQHRAERVDHGLLGQPPAGELVEQRRRRLGAADLAQQVDEEGRAIGSRIVDEMRRQRGDRAGPDAHQRLFGRQLQLVALERRHQRRDSLAAARSGRGRLGNLAEGERGAGAQRLRLTMLQDLDQRSHRAAGLQAPERCHRRCPHVVGRIAKQPHHRRQRPRIAQGRQRLERCDAHFARRIAEARQQRHHRARISHAPEHLGGTLAHTRALVVEPPGQRHCAKPAQRRRQLTDGDHGRLAHLVLAVTEGALQRLERAHVVLGRLVGARPLEERADRLRRRCAQMGIGIAERGDHPRQRVDESMASHRRRRVSADIGIGVGERQVEQRPRLVGWPGVELVDGVAPARRIGCLELAAHRIEAGEEIAARAQRQRRDQSQTRGGRAIHAQSVARVTPGRYDDEPSLQRLQRARPARRGRPRRSRAPREVPVRCRVLA